MKRDNRSGFRTEKSGDKKARTGGFQTGGSAASAFPGSSYQGKKFDPNYQPKPPAGGLYPSYSAKKKFTEVVDEAKKVWEQARQTELEAEKRAPLIAQLYQMLSGKLSAVVLRHDASRVVQTMVKYGDAGQRVQVAKELVPHTVTLAKSHYGKYLLMKILRYAPPKSTVRNDVIAQFKNQMSKLLSHKEAAHVLEYLYTELSGAQRILFLREIYGPGFTLFYQPPPAASKEEKDVATRKNDSIFELVNADAALKRQVLSHMQGILARILHKGPPIIEYSVIHKLLREYWQLLDDTKKQEFAVELKELVVHILHTRDGAFVGAQCVRYSAPKDRKVLIRQFKGYVGRASEDEYGHLVVAACLSLIDDTVMLSNGVLKALVSPTASMALPSPNDPDLETKTKTTFLQYLTHPYARKPLLQVLSPNNRQYFSPTALELFSPCSIATLDADGNTNLKPTSRKAPEDRRRELLDSLQSPLTKEVVANALALATAEHGHDVLCETVFAFYEADQVAFKPLLDVLAANALQLLASPYGSKTLIRLLADGSPVAPLLLPAVLDKIAADAVQLAQHEHAGVVVLKLLQSQGPAAARIQPLLQAAGTSNWADSPSWYLVKIHEFISSKSSSKSSSSKSSSKSSAAASSTPSKSSSRKTPSKPEVVTPRSTRSSKK